MREIANPALAGALSDIHTPAALERTPRSTLCAEAAKNHFTFAEDPLTKGTRARPGHVVPLHVFNVATAVADKVVMPHAFRIESRGAALHSHFSHQARLYQVPQIVIGCGSRGAWIHVVYGLEDFCSRRMPVATGQECHHGVALRRAPQPAAFQGPSDRVGIHLSYLEYI
jgi:hypothetical protein